MRWDHIRAFNLAAASSEQAAAPTITRGYSAERVGNIESLHVSGMRTHQPDQQTIGK
jgi:hypothetical protein